MTEYESEHNRGDSDAEPRLRSATNFAIGLIRADLEAPCRQMRLN
jgi:hypothetical protein